MSEQRATTIRRWLVMTSVAAVFVSSTATGAITGGDGRAITGGDIRAITGGDIRAITGGDIRAITGGDIRAITGGDIRAITGGDGRAITGGDTRLLLVGRVDYVGDDFVSVLGQTVFVDRASFRAVGEGSAVAVYGSLDGDTGAISNASMIDAGIAGFGPGSASFLTGFVDSVDYAKGHAVVSGKQVDYTALLSNGSAPNVGDMVSVTGRDYGAYGTLVADPQMRLEIR
ncbi:MAG: hypothetical protein O3A13_13705 [Proteobacteria bacterium]|nr:hypothetical protein [Pseudomonadota bacterium]